MNDPSPLVQATVYMVGILIGYTLLVPGTDWKRAKQAIREIFDKES